MIKEVWWVIDGWCKRILMASSGWPKDEADVRDERNYEVIWYVITWHQHSQFSGGLHRAWPLILKLTCSLDHMMLVIVSVIQSAEIFHHAMCFSSVMSLGRAAWTFGHVGLEIMGQLARLTCLLFNHRSFCVRPAVYPSGRVVYHMICPT